MRAAGDDTPTLPEDPAALRALLLSAWAERDALATRCDGVAAERDALAARNDRRDCPEFRVGAVRCR
jgi:transposase